VIATADLFDQLGEQLQSISIPFRNFGTPWFEGPVRTLQCREDNALLKATVSESGGGAVLVVDGGGFLTCALIGDVIAGIALENGWAGAVIYGAVRDQVALATLPFGVKALGTNPRTSGKTGKGSTDIVVEFGGVRFRPGARLYSDEDGIVVER